MLKPVLCGLSLLGLAMASSSHAASFADSVISYTPGTGFAVDFGTGLGFTNAAGALGFPSQITPGQFGGPVDPFSPPYLSEQLVSIGTGGSLTVGFSSPLFNRAENPFGLDFIIFGSAGFTITNGNFTGGGITDGSMFGANTGISRVSVSADNLTYFTLDPSLTPTVDALFPTDGSGNFNQPVDPSLAPSQFSGRDLAGIRSLYGGSAGGMGFDIGWARDANGQRVDLSSIQYIRIDILSGAAEIDGIVAVPEPSTYAVVALGAVLFAWRSRRTSVATNSQ